MKSTILNPFAANRFEYEYRNFYYLPPKTMRQLSERKSAYLLGSRGCGKTTFLKSFSWQERLENEFLRRELKDEPFADKILGLYIRLPHDHFSTIQKWLKDLPEAVRASIFSLYLDMIWIESAIEALFGMNDSKVIKMNEIIENKTIEEIKKIRGFNIFFKNLKPEEGLRGVLEIIKQKREKLETLAIFEAKFRSLELKREFPFFKVGELGRIMGKILVPTISGDSWHFKVCFDETETLNEFERKLMNTLVRLSESSVSYLVCFVRKEDYQSAGTLEPNISLQAADVNTVTLDDLDDTEFIEFVEGVVKARLQGVLHRKTQSFSLEKVFGTLEINNLLFWVLSESENPEADQLLKQAKKRESLIKTHGKNGELPIYETYLLEMYLKEKDKNFNIKKINEREFRSPNVRKKMAAVFTFLCRTYRKNGCRFAYSPMITQLSDGCIRDFLMFISEIFLASKKSLNSFTKNKISIKFQDKGIQKASEKKWESFSKFIIFNVEASKLLVEKVGKITSILQGPESGKSAIDKPERGIFKLRKNNLRKQDEDIFLLIKGAAEAGFLKIIMEKNDTLEFRLHKALAPKFRCSYRGAYYPAPIDTENFVELYHCKDQDFDRKSRELLIKGADKKQMDLL